MKKVLLGIVFLGILSGCASTSQINRLITDTQFQDPEVESTVLDREEYSLPKPADGPIIAAVYSFQDRTGQRKPNPNVANLSSAVTQGAETYLIEALKEAGNGQWFKIVERVGLDNLMKERQIIRQIRDIYDGENAQPLPPLLFAGVLIEGGIVGYDSNVVTGGSGMRILGIGPQTQYRADMITVSIRVVSITTGEVIVSVLTTKTVYSYMDKLGVLRFVESSTKAIEVETGMGMNESVNRATSMAIQAAVVEMIRQGESKGYWDYDPQSQRELSTEVVGENRQQDTKEKISLSRRVFNPIIRLFKGREE